MYVYIYIYIYYYYHYVYYDILHVHWFVACAEGEEDGGIWGI